MYKMYIHGQDQSDMVFTLDSGATGARGAEKGNVWRVHVSATTRKLKIASMVRMLGLSIKKKNNNKISGVPGATGATAAIPAEDTSPEAATVSRVTALLTTQAV